MLTWEDAHNVYDRGVWGEEKSIFKFEISHYAAPHTTLPPRACLLILYNFGCVKYTISLYKEKKNGSAIRKTGFYDNIIFDYFNAIKLIKFMYTYPLKKSCCASNKKTRHVCFPRIQQGFFLFVHIRKLNATRVLNIYDGHLGILFSSIYCSICTFYEHAICKFRSHKFSMKKIIIYFVKHADVTQWTYPLFGWI